MFSYFTDTMNNGKQILRSTLCLKLIILNWSKLWKLQLLVLLHVAENTLFKEKMDSSSAQESISISIIYEYWLNK